MKNTKFIPAAILMTSVAMMGNASAHDNNQSCNIDLNHGVTVTPEYIKVFNSNKTLYKIAQGGAMTVNGDSVKLTAEQQQLSAKYAQHIREAVPEAMEIANQAIELASQGVTTAFSALFGENSDIEYKISQLLEKAQQKIDAKMYHSGNEYTIAPNGMDNFEDIFDKEFEQEIEQVVMGSMGSIFSLLGEAMNSGSGDFEQRMEAFGKKMEKMGEDLEVSMEAQAEQLETQAEQFCQQLKTVDQLETQLQQQVEQFADMELLNMDSGK